MNREILFRAKIRSNNEWIYWNVLGQIKTLDYLDDCYEYQEQYYTDINAICGLIDLATVGLYTGLKDKNGDGIFTGHIVTIFGIKYTVVFECGSFGLATSSFIEYKPFEERIFEITGCNNRPRYTYNDNFIPLWEIYWKFNCEDNIINLIEIIGNIHEEN